MEKNERKTGKEKKFKPSISKKEQDNVNMELMRGSYFIAGLKYPFKGISLFCSRCMVFSILPELLCLFFPFSCFVLSVVTTAAFYIYYAIYPDQIHFLVGLIPIPFLPYPVICIVCMLTCFFFNMSSKTIRTADRSVGGKYYTPIENICCDPCCPFLFCGVSCALLCEGGIYCMIFCVLLNIPVIGPLILCPFVSVIFLGAVCLRSNYVYRCRCFHYPIFFIKHLHLVLGFGLGGLIVSIIIPFFGPLIVLASAQMLVRHVRFVEVDVKRKKNIVYPLEQGGEEELEEETEEGEDLEETEEEGEVEAISTSTPKEEEEKRKREVVVIKKRIIRRKIMVKKKKPTRNVDNNDYGEYDDNEIDDIDGRNDLLEDMGIDLPLMEEEEEEGILDSLREKAGRAGGGVVKIKKFGKERERYTDPLTPPTSPKVVVDDEMDFIRDDDDDGTKQDDETTELVERIVLKRIKKADGTIETQKVKRKVRITRRMLKPGDL